MSAGSVYLSCRGPFQLTCQTLATTWYATAGHDPADLDERRARAPWYHSKTSHRPLTCSPSSAASSSPSDFGASHPDQPTHEEIHAIRLAWKTTAA
jgi:hypothetical protein